MATVVASRPHGLARVLPSLACPTCYGALAVVEGGLACRLCGHSYPVVDGIPDLRSAEASALGEADWSAHWSPDRQRSPVQRFFSWYRQAVFARTVRYFIGRWFPSDGVFLEAGSGTAETSIRVEKGDRTLVALDVVLPVLRLCPAVMDVRVCGDIFRLPFHDDSVDGIWNVGVMEHFLQPEIDAILKEFNRVLRPGGRVIMLWPGVDSIPQKLLALVEVIVNLKPRPVRFRFHPAEISRLRSAGQARSILARNGFDTTTIDLGPRSLFAFKTVVGSKG